MKSDIEKIHDRMFERFAKAVAKFSEQLTDSWYEEFFDKVESGEIEVDEDNYKEVIEGFIDDFEKEQPKAVHKFIREYVDKEANKILDNKKLKREKAEIQLEVLKHLLLAGEDSCKSS